MIEDVSKTESTSKMKRLEKLLEDEISEMAKYIKLKLSFGIDIFSIQLPDTMIDIKKIILHILNKFQRTPTDNLVLRQYLISYPEFIDTLKLREQISDPKELLLKISQNLKKEEIYQDRVIFYNGQYGKSFYLILDGEVSVLLPYEYKLKLTDKQVIKYMYYLLRHKEYELIRLMFENNKHIFNDIDYRENTLYQKLKAYSDKALPNNTETEKISSQQYIYRYEYFSTIEKIQKYNMIKGDKKNNNKISDKYKKDIFDIFLKENIRKQSDNDKRTEIKKYENDEDDEEIIKNRKFFYEQEEEFSIYKYFEVTKLSKGKCFGELALTKEGKKRNATIITNKNSIFGILHKEAYQAFIKESMDKARKINVEHLLKCKLFRGYNSEKFESHYFSCFKLIKKKKGYYLFKQGEKRDFIYFLKKGEIQLELFGNIFYLEKIIKELGYSSEDDKDIYIKELIKSKKLDTFCKLNRNFKVLILSDESIGLEEHTTYPYNLEYAFSGLCASYCEMFALDIKFFNKMMEEKIIKNNYIHLIKDRKNRLAQRLNQLKINIILQQYIFLNKNIKYNNIANKNSFNEKREMKFNTFEKQNNNNFKTFFNDRNDNNYKYKFNYDTENKEALKTLDNNKSEKNEEKNSWNTLNAIKPFAESPSGRSSFRLKTNQYNDSPKRKLKLREQIINIKNSNIIINNFKKNNIFREYYSTTYSKKFIKKPKKYSLQLFKSNAEENSNKVPLKTEIFSAGEDLQEIPNKNQKIKKRIKYVNFRNIKIPKILLRQSNIFNAEIDKINEIVIDNYEKITPSSYKKPKKKLGNFISYIPNFSEDNKNKITLSNTFNTNFNKKFFPLPLVKNSNNINNNNYKLTDEEENYIISYFEKK